jgi:hypothetical protein
MKNRLLLLIRLFLICFFIVSAGCDDNKTGSVEFQNYAKLLLRERAQKDSVMQYSAGSPFYRDTTARFSNLKYFDPNPDFIFKTKIYYNQVQDTVFVLGTKGETRVVVIIGYVELNYKNKNYKVNVYRGFSRDWVPYHNIWFTDRTTGKETYGVGRYLDINLNEEKDFIYEIDFNKAYNPYCAYSLLYSCPIPREEDYIDISIEAGEKNFH